MHRYITPYIDVQQFSNPILRPDQRIATKSRTILCFLLFHYYIEAGCMLSGSILVQYTTYIQQNLGLVGSTYKKTGSRINRTITDDINALSNYEVVYQCIRIDDTDQKQVGNLREKVGCPAQLRTYYVLHYSLPVYDTVRNASIKEYIVIVVRNRSILRI